MFWATITTVGPEEDKHRLLIQVFEQQGAKSSGKKCSFQSCIFSLETTKEPALAKVLEIKKKLQNLLTHCTC